MQLPNWLRKIGDDVRNWAVNLIMTGLLVIVWAIGAVIWKAFRAQPIPWTFFTLVALSGIFLVIVALVTVKKRPAMFSPRPKFYPPNERPEAQRALTEADQQELNRLLNTLEQRTKEIVSVTKQGASIPSIESELLARCAEFDGVLPSGEFHRLALRGEELNNQIKDHANAQSERKTQDILNTAHSILQFVAAIRFQIAKALEKIPVLPVKQPILASPTNQTHARSQAAAEKEIRDSICRKLGQLAEDGNQMLGRVTLLQVPHDIVLQIDRWTEQCEEVLSTSLGSIAVAWFKSPAPTTNRLMLNPLRDNQAFWRESQLWDRLSSRVARLREIIEKVRTGEFSLC